MTSIVLTCFSLVQYDGEGIFKYMSKERFVLLQNIKILIVPMCSHGNSALKYKRIMDKDKDKFK